MTVRQRGSTFLGFIGGLLCALFALCLLVAALMLLAVFGMILTF